ncbi:WGxxGxxG family protein [Aureimonas sp. AU4]|uniref:WGxxGxxG family protein n=1 Tax=Aureimonas sp. AU4 TaxID=1638163 RepID=UPI00278C7AB0|nr:WGxxGxxG family protein [Aureimonas sp. AU4]
MTSKIATQPCGIWTESLNAPFHNPVEDNDMRASTLLAGAGIATLLLAQVSIASAQTTSPATTTTNTTRAAAPDDNGFDMGWLGLLGLVGLAGLRRQKVHAVDTARRTN